MNKQKIYDNSPIFIQNILTSIYGLTTHKQRYGKYYKEYINYLRNKDFGNLELELKSQNEQFIELFNNTIKKSSFYKEFYKNIDLNQIRSINDIKKLPILEKEVLRENIQDVITIDKSEGIMSQTGGTTGKSLKVYYTVKDMQKRIAYWDFYKEKHGLKKGMKKATFSGKAIIPKKDENKNNFWRYNAYLNQKLYSTFHLTNNNIKYYVDDLNKFKPIALEGFASCIYEIANYIKHNNVKLKFKPIAIFATSEAILDYQKQVIEEVFKAPVRNQYASSEGAPFITECKYGKLHYNLDTGIIEKVNIDGKEEILITGFNTYGTPLIRYRIGDNVIFEDEYRLCECGLAHPIINKIEGRKADFLYSEERGKVTLSNMSNVVKVVPNSIKNIQYIQNEVNIIDIMLVVDNEKFNVNIDEKLVVKEIRDRLGDKIELKINYIKEIPREKSGKYRMIKNNIKEKLMEKVN